MFVLRELAVKEIIKPVLFANLNQVDHVDYDDNVRDGVMFRFPSC